MNLYFIHTKVINQKLFIARRGRGFNEGGWQVEKEGWKIKIKRLRKTK